MEDGIPASILLGILLLMSAFFSASETSLVSLSRIRAKVLAEDGVKGAKTLLKLLDGGKYLSAILIGNNFVNIFVSSIVTSMVTRTLGGSGLVLTLTTVLVTLVILIVGEITPKSIAVKYSEKISLRVAAPISFFVFIITPVSWLLNLFTSLILKGVGGRTETAPLVTESEIKTLVDVGLEEGVIDTGERKMIHNVFAFGASDAKDIMTPRTDMVALPAAATYAETMKTFKEEQFTRIPVYKNDIDHIVGILHFKDFIFSDADEKSFNICDFTREPFYSYETKTTSDLLQEMRAQNANIAVIIDEYGGTSGIVALEDLIEEIVGEIYDEYDDDFGEKIELIQENEIFTEYVADGGVTLDDFNQTSGLELFSDDYDTIGGYVMGVLGQIPASGDSAEEDGISFLVDGVSKNRIEKLRITIWKQDGETRKESN